MTVDVQDTTTGTIDLAAVGDMNPASNTSTTSPSAENGAAIAKGLADGTLDAFFGLGVFSVFDRLLRGLCELLAEAMGADEVEAVLGVSPKPRLGAGSQRGPRRFHERAVPRRHV